MNTCAERGRSAVESLSAFIGQYPDYAEDLNITKFWIKYLNSTYAEIEKGAEQNNEIYISLCIEKNGVSDS
jgi:hypothetical protein